MLKFLKLTIIILSSIVLIAFLYFHISNNLFLESKNQTIINYLSKNKIELKNNVIDSTLFDCDFYNSKVFLLGEVHGFADNQIIDKELFLFLNKKLGIRYYIAEMDSITSKKLNQYLDNPIKKDQALLKEVVKAIGYRVPQQSSRELFDKWSFIYDYNKKLGDSSKIKVLGIDKNFDDATTTIKRDAAMMMNFKNYISKLKLQNEKFYGLFGVFHTLQSEIASGPQPFATQLKEVAIKTTTFVSYPIDSAMFLPKNPNYPSPPDEKLAWMNADGPLMLVKGINDLKELSVPYNTTLFKINGAKSPYYKSKNLISVKSRAFAEKIEPTKGTNTTDYFQYVFLIRNSKALSALK